MIKGPQIDISIPEQLNMTSYFLDENIYQGRGHRIAIYWEGQRYTYSDICTLTSRVGNVLKELGLRHQDRVILILQDSPEWVATWYATMKIGAVATHAYTYLPPSDYEYFLNYVRPKVAVVDNTTLDGVREGAKGSRYPEALLVVSEPPLKLNKGEYDFHSMVKSASDHLEAEPTSKGDLACWKISGGTTGKPRGVPHTHGHAVFCFQSFQEIIHYTENDVTLSVPKLFFGYARDLGMNWPFRLGAGVVLFPERSTPEMIFRLVKQYQPSILINVPTMMRAMLRTPVQERSDLGCLRVCTSGGEALSAGLYQEWKATFGVEVSNNIGSTEMYGPYILNRIGESVAGSPGKVAPGFETKIVDDAGHEVPKGEIGVLMVRGDSTGLYYWDDEEKSKRTFLADGWVNTGDLMREDEKGNLWYTGRTDDMVKVGGVVVPLLEIEKRLQEHPAITECAVVGVKDPDSLLKPKAFVVLKQGIEPSENMAEELKAFCKKKLAPYKYPRFVEFLSGLPKTGQGKIDRRYLREHGL